MKFDKEAEQAVLCSMLLDNGNIDYARSEGVNLSSFGFPPHKILYKALIEEYNQNKKIDTIILMGILRNKGDLKLIGGASYLNEIQSANISHDHLGTYITTLKDLSQLRLLIRASSKVLEDSKGNINVKEAINDLRIELDAINAVEDSKGLKSVSKLISGAMDTIEDAQQKKGGTGIPTGYIEFDKLTGGFQKGNMIVIAARPSVGKTAFALNIINHMVTRERKTIAFFSVEMTEGEIILRLMALGAGMDMQTLSTGNKQLNKDDWGYLDAYGRELSKSKLYIDDSPSLSIAEIKSRCRMFKKKQNIDCIFIDYLQLVKSGSFSRNSKRNDEVAEISSTIKAIAKELKIPVVPMVQLNREIEGINRKYGEFKLSDLKESGAIEQDADIVAFIGREEMVDKDTERKGIADVVVAKNRNGPVGRFELGYVKKFTKFVNLEED